MKLILVRHAKTDWNDKGLVQGMSDISLNENGIKQALDLKEKLSGVRFDLCITSPLKRAVQTAEIITNNTCPMLFDNLLIERNMGNYEGKDHKEYLKLNFWDLNKNSNLNGVEPVKEILERAGEFFNKLKSKHSNKTVLVVTHSAVLRALHFIIVGYDDKTDFYSFKPENASVYEYDI